jgi:hypothetical protein
VFAQKLGKTATETYEILQQAFGKTALSRSKTSEWYSRFKNGKTMLIAFFDAEGVVHHEFLPQHQTMNQKPFCNAFEMQFVGNGLTNRLPEPAFCTTTMRRATRP